MRTTVFNQIGLDSGALGLLGSVVHRFDEPGHYVGTALVDDEARADFAVVVSKDGPPAAQVDLSALRASKCDDRPTYRVGVGGYVSFYVGSGNERWATVVGLPKSRTPEFDSRRLDKGDVFAATVLRPGTYAVRNEYGKARTELAVKYVTRGKERYRPGEPVKVKMGAQASRKSMRLGPAQGVVFEITEPSRIHIDLTRPDDGRYAGK